jgi:hypothetical protein
VSLEQVAGGPALGSPASVTVAIDPATSDDRVVLNELPVSK